MDSTRESGVSLSGEGVRYKSCDAFIRPEFFLVGNRAINGVANVIVFKNVFTLETCFQVFYCAFHKHANSEVQKPTTIAFLAVVNHLNGPLRKQNFTLTGSKGQVL